MAGYSLYAFAGDIKFGYKIAKVGESLIKESPNRHTLHSTLCMVLENTIKITVEPFQSVASQYMSIYSAGRCKILCSILTFEPIAKLTSTYHYYYIIIITIYLFIKECLQGMLKAP